MSQLIITAVGPDHPGLVGELTSHLHASGANLLDSRMVNLRGEFAMIILIEVPEDAAKMLARELPRLGESMKLHLTVIPQQIAAARPIQGVPYVLRTYSLDQPGIVARITSVLRNLNINIEDLTARQESAPFAGDPLFQTEMRLTVPPTVSLRQLRIQLESIGNELNCDVDLDPA
jgi:glycine cleavage system transcriptional repressor